MTRSAVSLPKPLGFGDLQGRSVLIVGLGREGRAVATRLQREATAQSVIALEGKAGDHTAIWEAEFGETIPVILGGQDGRLPPEASECDVAVMSPGVAMTSPFYRAVAESGARMTSGSALFAADNRERIVGVTGSKGKSTTTTLIHHLLRARGSDVEIGGNMGIPVLGLPPASSYVLEFSSYQCHYLEVSPDVAVFTALFPEHLDWHGSLDRYYTDKLSLAAFGPRVIVANGDDVTLRAELSRRYPGAPIEWVGEGEAWHREPDGSHSWLVHGDTRLVHSSETGLLGAHNHHNALIALAAATAASTIDPGELAGGFAGFEPLPHRLEPIHDPSGVVFVNDSLATNPQAAAAALDALAHEQVVLLLGGMDRGVDYNPLLDQLVRTPPAAVLGLPESGPRLIELAQAALEESGVTAGTHLEAVSSMREAILRARGLASPGDYVVLSPAAPSFGIYRDFAHRAEDFRYWIENTRETR